MIYTVTLNPSLDYAVGVDGFLLGATNRTKSEQILPGGKGINVSIMLKNLGIESTVLGFLAGFTGDEIQRKVKEAGCKTDFIRIEEGMSRINIKLKSDVETEVNGMGPVIKKAALNQLFERLEQLKQNDVLVLAGSIPVSMPSTVYQEIMDKLSGKGVTVVVDAAKDLLVNVLEKHPFLIKPNHHELGEIFGVELKTKDEVKSYAKKLMEMGARNVLISMAGDGAVFLGEDGSLLESPAPKGKVINSVGAGDSMVAGFLAGYFSTKDYEEAFRMGIAAGSASAFSKELATKEEVLAILNRF